MDIATIAASSVILGGIASCIWVIISIPRFIIGRIARAQRLSSLRAAFWLDPAERIIEEAGKPFRKLEARLDRARTKVTYWESMMLSASLPGAGPYASRPEQRVRELKRAQKHLARFQKLEMRHQMELDVAMGVYQPPVTTDASAPDEQFGQLAALVALQAGIAAPDVAPAREVAEPEHPQPVSLSKEPTGPMPSADDLDALEALEIGDLTETEEAPEAPAPEVPAAQAPATELPEIDAEDLGGDLDDLVVHTAPVDVAALDALEIPPFDVAEKQVRQQARDDKGRREANSGPKKPRKPRAKKARQPSSDTDGPAAS